MDKDKIINLSILVIIFILFTTILKNYTLAFISYIITFINYILFPFKYIIKLFVPVYLIPNMELIYI